MYYVYNLNAQKIQFAKSKSNVVSKKDGVAKVSTKRSREESESNDEEIVPKEPRLNVESPNHILFINNLPPNVGEEVLNGIFQSSPGFKEVRTVPGNASIAFVEFDNEIQAGIALKEFNGIPLADNEVLNLSFSN